MSVSKSTYSELPVLWIASGMSSPENWPTSGAEASAPSKTLTVSQPGTGHWLEQERPLLVPPEPQLDSRAMCTKVNSIVSPGGAWMVLPQWSSSP